MRERNQSRDKNQSNEKQFEEILLEVRRVTRVTTGGRRLSFRAVIVVGDKKGKVGLGVSKSQDVAGAVQKATHEAYKNIITVPVVGADTVPYAISYKFKSAIIKLIPATAGTGLKAGSSVRTILDVAGYHNVLSKIVGTNNKLNNAIATLNALSRFKVNNKSLKTFESKEEKVEEVKEAPAKKTTKKATKKATKKTTKKATKKATKKTTKKTTK